MNLLKAELCITFRFDLRPQEKVVSKFFSVCWEAFAISIYISLLILDLAFTEIIQLMKKYNKDFIIVDKPFYFYFIFLLI